MLWSNNLILNNEIKIPSNDKLFFIIQPYWKYSLKIVFDVDNVNLENLFIILQSYLWNNSIKATRLYTFYSNQDEEDKILSYSNVFIIKKMNLLFFSTWWEERLDYDKKYMQNSHIYGVIITFSENSVLNFINKNKIKLEDFYLLIRPIYPWNENIQIYLNFFH